MDSDSSVDRVDVDGKLYRLKCDCCKSKRSETEYDFHPCRVEKCTFAICWACLQRWKDQSDKDVTKRFECPQCHTEYDTKLIDSHKPLHKYMIKKVNEKAKYVKKTKKKRKKTIKQKKSKEQEAKLKYLEKRRLEINDKNKKKKDSKNGNNNKNKNKKNESKNENKNNKLQSSTHVLNKNRIHIYLNNNIIIASQWTDKMITEIFGKIGKLTNFTKTNNELIIDFKISKSDKARRVLLYLFDLDIIIDYIPIHKHAQKNNKIINDNDIFNPNTIGIREFLKRRDKKLNWNEYSIPSFDISPPGCKRLIPKTVRRLTKHEYLTVISSRSKHSHSHRAHRPPIHNNINANSYSNSMSDLNSRPPPITATSSLGSMHTNNNGHMNMNHRSECQPMNININSYNWNGMNNSTNNNNSNSVSPAHTPYKMHKNNINNRNSPPGIAMGGNNFGLGAMPKIESGLQRSTSTVEMKSNNNTMKPQWNIHRSNDDILYNNKRNNNYLVDDMADNKSEKQRKIEALMGRFNNNNNGNKMDSPLSINNGLKWQRKSPPKNQAKLQVQDQANQSQNQEEKRDEIDISRLIRWKCGTMVRVINIVSDDDDELSDSEEQDVENENENDDENENDTQSIATTDTNVTKSTNVTNVTNVTHQSVIENVENVSDANELSKQNSLQSNTNTNKSDIISNVNGNDNDDEIDDNVNDNDYDAPYKEYAYSDSSDDDNEMISVNNASYKQLQQQLQQSKSLPQNPSFPTRAPIIRPPSHEIERQQKAKKIAQIQSMHKRPSPPMSPPQGFNQKQETDEGQQKLEIKDMTIQQMLDNLENFEGDQVDAILAKLLSNNSNNNNNNNNNGPTKPPALHNNNINNNNKRDYESDDSNYMPHPNPSNYPQKPRPKNDHISDLDFIAKSMGGSVNYNHSYSSHSQYQNNNNYNNNYNNNNYNNNAMEEQEQEEEQEISEPGAMNNDINDIQNHIQNDIPNDWQDPYFESHRHEMTEIGKYYEQMPLSKLPDYYLEHFGTTIKSTYTGKLKDLVKYFDDIFKVKHNSYKNSTSVISKIFNNNNNNNNDNNDNNNGHMNMNIVQREKIKRLNSNNKRIIGKNNGSMRWTPKRKEEPNKVNEDNTAFKFGPSAMYTVPRRAPKSHTHIIGQTAAVGNANAYKSGYKASARPYSSSRRSGGYGTKKVKTYGDYEDELPHTPSASEEDDM